MSEYQTNHQVHVAPSPIHGQGLFATCALQAGRLIGIYEGPEVVEDGIYVLWIENETGENWTGYNGVNEMRFLNHSDEPNAEMDGLNCYALHNIARGAEITIDYGWNDS